MSVATGTGILCILQQRENFLRRQRFAVKKALHGVAAAFEQEVELLLRFHPFGHHLEAQAVSHGDDGGHDRRVIRSVVISPTKDLSILMVSMGKRLR